MSTIKTNQLAHTANGASVYTLPTTDGSAGQVLQTNGSGVLSWVSLPTPGITEADQWRYTADVTFGQYAANLVTNWERNDTEFTKIGTGMSVNTSNGHWTFPSTGIWLIQVHWQGHRASGATNYGTHYMFAMNDGVQSNGFDLATSSVGVAANQGRNTAFMQAIFDVTNTTTHKLLFGHYDDQVHTTVYQGHTGKNENSYTFIRLGDT